jgi:hypothetical protein
VNVNAAPAALVASMIASAGTVTTGRTESVTVTVNEAVPVLWCASVAVQVTVVAPIGNTLPLTGVQLVAIGPSTLSVAVALNVNTAPSGPVASTVALDGTVPISRLRSVSFTVTLKLPVEVLPARSLAWHCTVVVPIGKNDPLGGSHITGCSRRT